MPLEQNQPPVPLDAGQLGVGHLASARASPRSCRAASTRRNSPRMPGMAGRQPAAVGVGGQRAAEPQPAALDERPALALGAEAEVLERDQHHVGEGVVELGRRRCRPAVTPARSKAQPARHRGRDRVKSSHSAMVVCETCSPAPSTHTGGFGSRPTRSSAASTTARAAVGAEAAVQLGERVGDHRAAEHVVDGDRLAVPTRPG